MDLLSIIPSVLALFVAVFAIFHGVRFLLYYYNLLHLPDDEFYSCLVHSGLIQIVVKIYPRR